MHLRHRAGWISGAEGQFTGWEWGGVNKGWELGDGEDRRGWGRGHWRVAALRLSCSPSYPKNPFAVTLNQSDTHLTPSTPAPPHPHPPSQLSKQLLATAQNSADLRAKALTKATADLDKVGVVNTSPH